MISSTITTLFLVAGGVGVALPVIGFFFQEEKSQKRMYYILVGALTYILISLFFKDAVQYAISGTDFYKSIVESYTNNASLGNYLPYLLYQLLFTAGFDILAFFLAYLFVKKKEPSWVEGYYLGLGYAAMGIIFTLTIPLFQNFQYANLINDGSIYEMIGQNGITQEYVTNFIQYIQQYDVMVMVLYIGEAVLRFLATIAIAIFILEGIEKKKEWQYYLIAFGYLILAFGVIRIVAYWPNMEIISLIIGIIIYAPAIYYLFKSKKRFTEIY